MVIEVRDRTKFLEYMDNFGIEVGVHYPTAIHHQKAYKRFESEHLPNTTEIAKNVVSIPIYQKLKNEELEK